MSKLIPARSVEAFRSSVDVTMDMYGIDCVLYVPTTSSLNTAEKLDAYTVPADLDYTVYNAKVFIDVTPDIKRLRKLGLYTEDSLPIVAKFGREVVATTGSNAGEKLRVDIVQRSWFRITIQHLQGTNDYTDLEVVDIIPPEFHDAVIWQEFLVAPRRLRE